MVHFKNATEMSTILDDAALMTVRVTPHTATGLSPEEMLTGTRPLLPTDVSILGGRNDRWPFVID